MSREELEKLNNTAQYCTVLSFDEKRGLQPDNIISLLASFREIVENITWKDDYEDFSVFVTPIHNGDDPEFLCYLRKTPFTEEEAQEVYEFLMEDSIEEYEIES